MIYRVALSDANTGRIIDEEEYDLGHYTGASCSEYRADRRYDVQHNLDREKDSQTN
jgi:hypothetical protein